MVSARGRGHASSLPFPTGSPVAVPLPGKLVGTASGGKARNSGRFLVREGGDWVVGLGAFDSSNELSHVFFQKVCCFWMLS